MTGLRNIAAQKNLLSEENLTLEKAIRVVQSLEAANKNAKKLKADDAMSAIHRTSYYPSHYRFRKPPRQPGTNNKTCYRCGGTDHIATTAGFVRQNVKSATKRAFSLSLQEWI